jgi:hypothetical protein
MKERTLVVNLLNGFYKMSTQGDYDLITDSIMKCPKKVADPLCRAIMSYEYLMPDKSLDVLMKTFNLYKDNFMKVTDDEGMAKVVDEAEKIKAQFTVPEESAYAGRMLAAFIDEIELAYKETANTNVA